MAKDKQTNESFETSGNSNFTALFWDMFDSKAWRNLSSNDINVYMNMRRKYSRRVLHGVITNSNKDNIEMPKDDYLKFIGQVAFANSIDSLIDNGFIKVIKYKPLGGSRNVIIYGFADMWKYYGTSKFIVKEEYKRIKNRKYL